MIKEMRWVEICIDPSAASILEEQLIIFKKHPFPARDNVQLHSFERGSVKQLRITVIAGA